MIYGMINGLFQYFVVGCSLLILYLVNSLYMAQLEAMPVREIHGGLRFVAGMNIVCLLASTYATYTLYDIYYSCNLPFYGPFRFQLEVTLFLFTLFIIFERV